MSRAHTHVWLGKGVRKAVPVARCAHLGGPTGATVACGTCPATAGKTSPVHRCAVYGECLPDLDAHPMYAACGRCRSKPAPTLPQQAGQVPPLRATRVRGLATAEKDEGFNASLLRWRGKLLLAYRTGWEGSDVRVATLGEDFQPLSDVPLDLSHPLARLGREDPRLFVHRGALHVAFIGVARGQGGRVETHQLYARLSDGLAVEQVHAPEYAGRQWPKEKNWSFFTRQGELYAAYSCVPHVVLRIDGGRAYPFAEVKLPLPWNGGHLRGGASPVLVGGEWWHWVHGADDSQRGFRRYSVGVVCFEDRPPFRPTRVTVNPLLWADDATAQPAKAIVFPCGVTFEGGVWSVSAGVQDAWTTVYEWPHAEVEGRLVDV